MEYFFVGGAPKSGTTWMQKAIDAHPDAVCSGEGHFHGLIVKPMLDMFATYNDKLASVNRIVYADEPYHLPLTRREVLGAIRNTIIGIMARRASPRTLALGDKTPVYANIVRDLDLIFPDMRFVLMVRDPRDVTTSRLHQIRRTQGSNVLDHESSAYREAVTESAEAWATAHERCRGFAADCPDRLLAVRYEDFLDEPAAVLTRVFAFLRLPTKADLIDIIAHRTSFETLSGRRNGMEDQSSFFRKGVKGDWRSTLDPWASGVIVSMCGSAMTQLGYRP